MPNGVAHLSVRKAINMIDPLEDRIVSFNTSIWSHLITINTFSITLYSVLLGIKENIPKFISFYIFPVSLVFALVSIVLLLYNFISYRNSFALMAKHAKIKDKKESGLFFKNHIKELDNCLKKGIWYEQMAQCTFIVNFIIIFIILIWPTT
ncbi:MAG: hypothetical protein ACUZ8N_06820 [Candidatus Scalindua sp.]